MQIKEYVRRASKYLLNKRSEKDFDSEGSVKSFGDYFKKGILYISIPLLLHATIGYARKKVTANYPEPQPIERTVEFYNPPEPKPVESEVDIGVYYINGWGIFRHGPFYWYPALPPIKPLLGYYRADDPDLADWHIKWAVEHGIDHFVVGTTKPGMGGMSAVENNFDEYFLNSDFLDDIKFSMNYNIEPHYDWSEEKRLSLTQHTISYFATHYFTRPQYKKINGRPIVTLWHAFIYRDKFGQRALNKLVDMIRETGKEHGYDIYLVGDVMCDNHSSSYVRSVVKPFDAISNYNWIFAGTRQRGKKVIASYDSMVKGINYENRFWSRAAERYGKDYIPIVTPGFDCSALYETGHYDWLVVRTKPTPEKFKKMVEGARKYIDPDINMIYVSAWNEWQEGSAVEPSEEFGFDFLKVLRDVFCEEPVEGWPREVVPSKAFP